MKKRRHSMLADLSFQAMLILLFAAVLFLAYDHVRLAENGILLCVVTVMLMVTYFTSIRVGFVMDIVFVLLLVAYTALRTVQTGSSIGTNIYFWIFWPMGMIVSVYGYVRENHLLEEENRELVRRTEKYGTIDELTQVNNLLGFERDAAVYMNISRRYHMELGLVLWRLTYQKDLERLLGKEDMRTAVGIISDSIKNSLRKEDLVYLVDRDPYIWGTLLFSKPEAAQIVVGHVREGVEKGGLGNLTRQKNYSLEITGTAVVYDGSMLSPLAFLDIAKKQFWIKDYHAGWENPPKPGAEASRSVETEKDAVREVTPKTVEAKEAHVEKSIDIGQVIQKPGRREVEGGKPESRRQSGRRGSVRRPFPHGLRGERKRGGNISHSGKPGAGSGGRKGTGGGAKKALKKNGERLRRILDRRGRRRVD